MVEDLSFIGITQSAVNTSKVFAEDEDIIVEARIPLIVQQVPADIIGMVGRCAILLGLHAKSFGVVDVSGDGSAVLCGPRSRALDSASAPVAYR